MARITSQKAAQVYGGLFDLVLGASQRAREIRRGSAPKVKCDNGAVVTALREVEEGLYTKKDYMDSLPKSKKKKGYKDEYFPS
jgi:DNA-directed RNA polymerase omega subunit